MFLLNEKNDLKIYCIYLYIVQYTGLYIQLTVFIELLFYLMGLIYQHISVSGTNAQVSNNQGKCPPPPPQKKANFQKKL